MSFPSVFIVNYFEKLPACRHIWKKTSMNLVSGPKLKTSWHAMRIFIADIVFILSVM